MAAQVQHDSKTRLLNAALHVVRSKGYAASTVDDICAAAGVTKGSFFHHFKTKDELALAAAAHFSAMAESLFATAPYHDLSDPLERLLGYVDFRAHLLLGELPDYTCLLGTLVQETYATHPDIRAACEAGMSGGVEKLWYGAGEGMVHSRPCCMAPSHTAALAFLPPRMVWMTRTANRICDRPKPKPPIEDTMFQSENWTA